MAERLGHSTVKFGARRLERRTLLGAIGEKVLRVVQEADVERLEAEPLERSVELVLEPLRMDAVPEALPVLHHLRERRAALLARHGKLQILTLGVPDLRYHHDRVAPNRSRPIEIREHPPDEALGIAARVVRGRINQIDPLGERPGERLGVLVDPVVYAIRPEPEAAHRKLRRTERHVRAATAPAREPLTVSARRLDRCGPGEPWRRD